MTTKYMNTTGIQLYKIEGETYCKMIDVVKLIHHECYETDNKEIRDMLDRMEARVVKNDFLLPTAEKPKTIYEKKFPKRYAVGYSDEKDTWHFYVATNNGKDIFSEKPCEAKMYATYRDASACADFLDKDADVLDFEVNMPEEDRWLRELNMPMPYDADEGNENSIPVEIVT